MGEEPDAVRQQIEQTRERMGDTVEAIAYKADVPARAKESINERVDTLKGRVSRVGSRISSATPSTDDVKGGARSAAGVAQENPLGLAVGATALGFLIGMMMPGTRVENERVGPIADQLKEQARQTGQEALERGKQVAQESVQVATEKAQEGAAEVRDRAQESARGHADELAETVKRSAGQGAASSEAPTQD